VPGGGLRRIPCNRGNRVSGHADGTRRVADGAVPDVPREAVLKEDLLRTGIAFDESALSDNLDGDVKPKSYFIFSFDQKPSPSSARRRDGGRRRRSPSRAARYGLRARSSPCG
jgi:hypothetical protein